jgi:hypothetical protein
VPLLVLRVLSAVNWPRVDPFDLTRPESGVEETGAGSVVP